MKSTKTRALIVLVILALGSAWLLPGVAGAGKKKDPKKGLARRVKVLEEQVADLIERVEDLEQGQAPPATSFDLLHLNPLAEFPPNPTDGDICVVLDECNGEDMYNFMCYMDGTWAGLLVCNPIIR